MSESLLEEYSVGEQPIEYWRTRWELVNTPEENPKPVPQYVLESGNGLIAALEAKLKAMKRVRLAAEALSADVHEAFPEGLIDMPDYAQLIYELDAALAAAQKE